MSSFEQHLEPSVEVAERLSPLARTKRADAYHHAYPEYCPEGIPVEQALFAILATFAAAFGFLYTAVTMRQGRRRKRRSEHSVGSEGLDWTVWSTDLLSASEYETLSSSAKPLTLVVLFAVFDRDLIQGN